MNIDTPIKRNSQPRRTSTMRTISCQVLPMGHSMEVRVPLHARERGDPCHFLVLSNENSFIAGL